MSRNPWIDDYTANAEARYALARLNPRPSAHRDPFRTVSPEALEIAQAWWDAAQAEMTDQAARQAEISAAHESEAGRVVLQENARRYE